MMDKTFIPEVLQVVPADGYSVYAYFNDGSIHLYDASPLIEKGGVFEKIRDKAIFNSTLTVMNGTLAWDITGNRDTTKCIDIDPFTVFESPVAEEPSDKTPLRRTKDL